MKKLIKKNNQLIYIALLLFILLAFSVIGNSFKKDIIVEMFGQKIENKKNKNIYAERLEVYVSLETFKKYIDTGVYYDKISRSLIITHNDQILKMEIGENIASLNYTKIKLTEGPIKKGNEIYIPFSSIEKIYGIEGLVSKNKKNVYILESNTLQVNLKNSNVNVYSRADIRNISKDKLNRKDKVTAYYNSISSDFILVKTEKDVVGYIEKYNLSKDSITKLSLKIKELENNILAQKENSKTLKLNGVVATTEDNISSVYKQNDVNNIFINAFEIFKINGEIDKLPFEADDINKFKNIGNRVYGNISNGYSSSNFDNTVLLTVIKNLEARELLVQNISKEVAKYNLDGITIDFENIKKIDEEIYVQFLKEVSVAMKSMNKKLFVYSMNSTSDLDISKALDYIDYYIIKGYNYIDIYSNLSKSGSNINTIKSNIDKILNINKGQYAPKVVIQLPLFSILWEEKNSIVQNTKIYDQKEVEAYIKENKLNKILDKKIDQNYVEMTKGIVKYKMWIEDEYSIKSRMSFIKKYNLAGVILYKAGYEKVSTITNIFK